jgi:hypothetical protein
MQSAKIADASPHHASVPLHASMVSRESDSARILEHPIRYARARPSFMARASAVDAEAKLG